VSRDHFPLQRGVRQGGVLSSVFYTVYIDDLIQLLADSGCGTYVNDVFTGVVVYADDIFLLAPTRCALQHMLDICNRFGDEWLITFNPTKSSIITFPAPQPRLPALSAPTFFLQGQPLVTESDSKHLGFILSSNIRDQQVSMRRAISKFHASVFFVLSRCRSFNPLVLAYLLVAKCLPVLLYGSEFWDTKSVAFKNSAAVAWSNATKRCLRLGKLSRNTPAFIALHSMPLEFFIYHRKCSLVCSSLYSTNFVVRHLMQLCYFQCIYVIPPPKSVALDVVNFCKQHGIDCSLHGLKRKLHATLLRKLYMHTVLEQDFLAGGFIRDICTSNDVLSQDDYIKFREICSAFATRAHDL